MKKFFLQGLFWFIFLGVLLPPSIHASSITFKATGIFDIDSVVTTGLAGDTYEQFVTVEDTQTPISRPAGAFQFNGTSQIFINNVLFFSGPGAVTQIITNGNAVFLMAAFPPLEVFEGFISNLFDPAIVYPGGADILSNPSVLVAQGVIGETNEFSPSLTRTGFQARLMDVGPNPIPEPSTMLLFGTGLAGFAAWQYRKKQIQ